jgi:chromosome segregation ATPase
VRVEPSAEAAERERAELEFDAMQLLARTSRWTGVQRDRSRERSESLMTDVKQVTKQRDSARKTVKRKVRRIESKNRRLAEDRRKLDRKNARIGKLRRRLRAERSRPWSRMRKRVKGLRKRVGRLLGR